MSCCSTPWMAHWTAAWDAEIAKRIEELDSGKVKTIPWAEVRRKMGEAK